MWLNDEQVIDSTINKYRESLLNSCPNHVVIDGLFDEAMIKEIKALRKLNYSRTVQRSSGYHLRVILENNDVVVHKKQ